MDVLVDIGLVDPAVQAVGPDHMDIKEEIFGKRRAQFLHVAR